MKNNTIETAIVRQAEHVRLLDIIIPVLEAERTKSVTKRLATRIQDAIAKHSIKSTMYVSYDPDKYGSKEVHIYGGVISYDDRLTVSFSKNWGDGWRLKSEQEATDDTIAQMHAWRTNGRASIEQLKQELARFEEMKLAYTSIANAYKNACEAFVDDYGTAGDFEKSISYTTRRALEEVTGVKIDL